MPEKPKPEHKPGYIDTEPLTDEDERIMERVDATFTAEDMDEWARQIDEERTREAGQK